MLMLNLTDLITADRSLVVVINRDKQMTKYNNVRIYLQGGHVAEFIWYTETRVSGAEDSMETNEAAAALLNMESPNNILDEKRMRKLICIANILLLKKVPNSWHQSPFLGSINSLFVFLCLLFIFSSLLWHSAGVRPDIHPIEARPDGQRYPWHVTRWGHFIHGWDSTKVSLKTSEKKQR